MLRKNINLVCTKWVKSEIRILILIVDSRNISEMESNEVKQFGFLDIFCNQDI